MESYKIFYFYLGKYPYGDVTTVRMHSYCKALAQKGIEIKVYIPKPSKNNINLERKGIFEGVKYEYLTKPQWPKYAKSVFKYIYFIYGLLKIIRLLKKQRPNYILLYSASNFFYGLYFYILSHLFSVPVFVDKTEYPYGYKNMNNIKKRIEIFKLHFFKGIITISNELYGFYKQYRPTFLLPMTVDPERFEKVKKDIVPQPYIAVTFSTHNRDCIYDTILSYIKYSKLVESPYNLWLLGNFEQLKKKYKEYEYVTQLINKNNLQQKVFFKGLVNIQEIPSILSNAECLLTTPREYISGGFPTKLGEYMLAKVPIVATSAGEISLYLEDQKDAYLVPPNDIDEIANKLAYVHTHKQEASQTIKYAYQKVTTVFNASTYIDNLITFFNNNNYQHA